MNPETTPKPRVLPILFAPLLIDMIGFGMVIPIIPVLFTDPTSPSFLLHGYSQGMQFFLAGVLTALWGVTQFIAAPIAAILGVGHWILLVLLTLVPTLVVRAVRDMRVKAIEQDLPLVLELFATMAEAGLGFDAAITKVVKAQGVERPLIGELVLFQYDMLAGMPRPQALRQLARRVDLPALTGFTSALIQAETVGASFAETLQYQAVELRSRRRENALLQAQSLPVKLVFPLVICFLPGIFASTLAPVLFQVVQVADGVLRGAGR